MKYLSLSLAAAATACATLSAAGLHVISPASTALTLRTTTVASRHVHVHPRAHHAYCHLRILTTLQATRAVVPFPPSSSSISPCFPSQLSTSVGLCSTRDSHVLQARRLSTSSDNAIIVHPDHTVPQKSAAEWMASRLSNRLKNRKQVKAAHDENKTNTVEAKPSKRLTNQDYSRIIAKLSIQNTDEEGNKVYSDRIQRKRHRFAVEKIGRLAAASNSSKEEKEQQRPIEPGIIPTLANAITIRNKQSEFAINEESIKQRIQNILEFLFLSGFEVEIEICSDKEMADVNLYWRRIKKSTDILSLPSYDYDAPGKLSRKSLQAIDRGEKHLGVIYLCPQYIQKIMMIDLGLLEDDRPPQEEEAELEDDEEYEILEDRGVSKALSTVKDLNERILLLLVHGMLHLLCYDHETDEDWEVMTAKEEQIMEKLQKFRPMRN